MSMRQRILLENRWNSFRKSMKKFMLYYFGKGGKIDLIFKIMVIIKLT